MRNSSKLRIAYTFLWDTLLFLLVTFSSIVQAQESTTENTMMGIVILTEPPDAMKVIDGQYVGRGNTFMVTAGEHELVVKMDGYHIYSASIYVDSVNSLYQGIQLAPKNRPRPIVNEYGVFSVFDVPPSPVNGHEAIVRAARKHYPRFDLTAGIEGVVFVQAIIGSDGRAIEAVVLKDVPHSNLGEAAVDVVTSIPWKPAIYQDQKVAVQISIPVIFKIR